MAKKILKSNRWAKKTGLIKEKDEEDSIMDWMMMIGRFTSPATLFKSYRDYVGIIMKGSV